MKRKIAVIIAAVLTAQSASAAVITRNSDGNIVISGNLGAGFENAETQIQILGPFDEKKIFSDAAWSGSTEPVFMENIYANSVKADSEGVYSFTYKISEENKYYLVAVAEPGADLPQTVNIYAAAEELLEKFIGEVNSADTAGKMRAILDKEEYKNLMEGNRSDYTLIKDEESIERLAEGLKNSRPYKDFTEFENILSLLCAVQRTNSLTDEKEARKIAEDKLYISKAELWDIYKNFSDTEKTNVFKRMLGRGISDWENYMTLFDESIFLEKIETEGYASNLTELINSNAQRFGFELSGYASKSTEVNKKLYGRYFKIMEDFKDALKTALGSAGNTNPPSGGGGGGGGKSPKPDSGNIIVPTGNQTKTEVPEKKGYFDDLGDALWAEDAINALAEKKIISGKEERKFFPKDNVKREEFVKMAVGAFEIAPSDKLPEFKDIDQNAWYSESIASAYEAGIISGKDESTFGIGDLITRQDMAVILYRAAVKCGMEFDAEREAFNDDGAISDYAKEAVYALKNKGVVSGTGDNLFEPKRNATRAEAARMIFTILSIEE